MPGNSHPFYLFFDTETTFFKKGPRPSRGQVRGWPRLVQIAWLQSDSKGKEICTASHIIKPVGFTITKEESEFHHISNERAARDGEDIRVTLLAFEQVAKGSDYMVAHNIEFDRGVLEAEYRRMGLAASLYTSKTICTMEESTHYCGLGSPYSPKWPKLEELYYKLFRARIEGSHDALVDVRATAKCFWELRRIGILKVGDD